MRAPLRPGRHEAETMAERMVRCGCIVCGDIYDPRTGDPTAGVQPGTESEALPDDRVCPECMVGKGQSVPVQE